MAALLSCVFTICVLLFASLGGDCLKLLKPRINLNSGKETWGFVNVKPNGYMFWWLYYALDNESYVDKPLVIWLQGGPGSSSTGFGNFGEMGPLDQNLRPREWTWVKFANILFVDNPVGTGFSYVTNDSALATNNSAITDDLIVFTKAFFQKLPEFQTVPFYIFSESYGGKMAAEFSYSLYKNVQSGKIPCNFKGVAFGDSWISPLDSILTWAPYLYSTSILDDVGLDAINVGAQKLKSLIDKGKFTDATKEFQVLSDLVDTYTHGIDFYNILLPKNPKTTKRIFNKLMKPYIKNLFNRLVLSNDDDKLAKLMNGPIRAKLKIVPENVTWGGQSGDVFTALVGDFMRPVTDKVEALLNNTNLSVVVYTGQLDLIVDSLGTMAWVKNLNWAGLKGFNGAERTPLGITNNSVAGFVKQYKNFSFYWILDAGHMIPLDAGETSVKMLNKVTGREK